MSYALKGLGGRNIRGIENLKLIAKFIQHQFSYPLIKNKNIVLGSAPE